MLHSLHTACKMRNDRFTGHILLVQFSIEKNVFVEKNVLSLSRMMIVKIAVVVKKRMKDIRKQSCMAACIMSSASAQLHAV